MTECERLVAEGFISESFLMEEVRNDFLISNEQKKGWAIYLDILRTIMNVCTELNLKYWVIAGTLLGTIRHKGFIPWDDDIDVCMPRKDYDILLKHGSSFSEPYFLRTPETDGDYYYSYACVCNCNTTYIGFMGSNKCHKGMAVSIIPIDGFPNYEQIAKLRFKRLKYLSVIGHAYAYNVNPNLLTRLIHKVLNMAFIHFDANKLYKKANRIASHTKWEDTDKVGILIYSAYRFEKNVFNKKDFEETIQLPFENLIVNVPKGYNGILSAMYGDYMVFPPVEKRVGRHEAEHDTDIPYLEYMQK